MKPETAKSFIQDLILKQILENELTTDQQKLRILEAFHVIRKAFRLEIQFEKVN